MRMRKELIWAVFAVMLLAAIPVKAAPDPGLVGLWHFDTVETPVDPLYPKWTPDSSGYGHTAYLYPIGSEPTLVPGKFGNALTFDGTNDYVRVDRTEILEPSQFSVEAWVKAASMGSYKYVVAKYFDGSKGSYAFYGFSTGIYFYIGGSWGYRLSALATGVWDGNWHHVVGTYDGTRIRIYKDGGQVGTGVAETRGATYNPAGPLNIGHYDHRDMFRFPGSIDEVRIWDQALTADQVKASYELGLATQINQQDLNGDGYPDAIFTSAFYLDRQAAGGSTSITMTILPVNPSVVVGYDIDGSGGVELDEYVVKVRVTPKGTDATVSDGILIAPGYSVTVTVTQGNPPCNSVHLWLYLSTGDHVGVNVQFLPYG